MKKLCFLLLILILLLLVGCALSRQELNTTMHFTCVYPPTGAKYSQFDADVKVLVSKEIGGKSKVHIDLLEDYFSEVDFRHEDNTYELMNDGEILPYYCVKASVYHPNVGPIQKYQLIMAVDFEKEYMIILYGIYPSRYYVSSSDPTVDYKVSLQHFEEIIPSTQVPDVDYDLHASVITTGGATKETMDVSIIDRIVYDHNTRYIAMGILTPDTFRYQHEVPTEQLIVPVEVVQWTQSEQSGYFVWRGYCYDKETGEYRLGVYAYSHAEKYLIMSWDDDRQEYLIASWTPQPPKKILTYFQDFINKYSYEE